MNPSDLSNLSIFVDLLSFNSISNGPRDFYHLRINKRRSKCPVCDDFSDIQMMCIRVTSPPDDRPVAKKAAKKTKDGENVKNLVVAENLV